MSDRSEKVEKEMGLMERILSYIPGYRGYKEKELRRETDRLVRMEVSSRLKKAKFEIRAQLSNPMVISSLSSEDMWLFDQLMSKLDRITQRIERAVAGYAGFFDAVKVREDRLDKVLEHDVALIEKAEAIRAEASKIRKLKPGSDEWKEVMMNLTSMVEEFDSLIDQRAVILRSLEIS
ncbi:MAG: hypothetical protein DRJ56_03665 [Thermoprotei archaeon]|nr:MAG: hypothetical protein DRJ56_03665 [Thermoprotei archaeon]